MDVGIRSAKMVSFIKHDARPRLAVNWRGWCAVSSALGSCDFPVRRESNYAVVLAGAERVG